MSVTVDPSGLREGLLVPPPSKSDAQRALVLARITGVCRAKLLSDEALREAPGDVRALVAGLEALSNFTGDEVEIDCGEGGAPFRFLLGQAAIEPGSRFRFTGSSRLGERPHGPLIRALLQALGSEGLSIESEESHPWPLRVRGARAIHGTPRFVIDARQSSQFASSLLLAAAALAKRQGRSWAVELEGGTASGGYLEMTLGWLEKFGFAAERTPTAIVVSSMGEIAGERIPPIPGDWSSLGYLLLVAWVSGARVANVDPSADHPDRAVLDVLSEIGLRLEDTGDGARVFGRATSGLRASGAYCPDLLPTLAALACVLPGDSKLLDVGILRHKESDRLEGIQELVKSAGGTTHLEGEVLEITPPAQVRPFAISTRGDHRMAMSAATLGALARVPVRLDDADCVAKSFPGFWRELEKVGVSLGR